MAKKIALVYIIAFLLIATISLIIAIFKLRKPINYAYYESDLDDFSIDYKDDEYDVFLEKENRHIFIPRSKTEIIISDDTEVVIEGKQFGDGRWEYNMYFYLYIDFEV